MRMRRLVMLAAAAALALFPAVTSAQETTATITGVVKDASGADPAGGDGGSRQPGAD